MPIKIENRIGVQAPADYIWEIISDINRFPEWSALYPKASGQVRIGQTLELTIAIDGQPHREIRPVILDWAPNDHIHWKLSAMMGLVQSTRYLEIEILDTASCIFSNGEIFSGFLGERAVKPMGRAIQRAFNAMGEAVKAKAEAAYQSARVDPT